jgi:hypothetical protein
MDAVVHDGRPPVARSTQVTLHASHTIDFSTIYRALAKVALNFVCKAVGPEVARRSVFDPLRRYVWTGESDSRARGGGFVVQNLSLGAPTGKLDALAKPGHHTLALLEFDGTPMVVVCLYDAALTAVRLTRGRARGALPSGTFEIGLFDYRTRASRLVGRLNDRAGLVDNYRPVGFVPLV